MTAAGIPALLEPIQARLNAATPGPWKADSYEVIASPYLLIVADVDLHMPDDQGTKNASFIAAAPTDTARLLAAVKAAVAEIADTDLETSEALQGDLADRILSAVEAALRSEAANKGADRLHTHWCRGDDHPGECARGVASGTERPLRGEA